MRGGDGHDHRLIAQALDRHALTRPRAAPERELELPACHLARQRPRAVLPRTHPHARAPPRQRRQEVLREVVHPGGEAEPQLALLTARVGARGLLGGPRRLHRGASRREHGGSGLGELDRAPGPGEQRHAELPLQPADLLAQGRLRDVESLRRTPEVQLVGEHDERAQQARVAPHARSL
jgi:hypothetical protein